jgi:hypothetical protein
MVLALCVLLGRMKRHHGLPRLVRRLLFLWCMDSVFGRSSPPRFFGLVVVLVGRHLRWRRVVLPGCTDRRDWKSKSSAVRRHARRSALGAASRLAQHQVRDPADGSEPNGPVEQHVAATRLHTGLDLSLDRGLVRISLRLDGLRFGLSCLGLGVTCGLSIRR